MTLRNDHQVTYRAPIEDEMARLNDFETASPEGQTENATTDLQDNTNDHDIPQARPTAC